MQKRQSVDKWRKSLLQPHNQMFFDEFEKRKSFPMGPYSSYTWRHDPKHLFITLARYKFCSKLLEGKKSLLEVGCGDSIGAALLLQTVDRVHGVDLEPAIINGDKQRNEFKGRLTFEILDMTKSSPRGRFEAAISLDVLEHIPESKEGAFIKNIRRSLAPQGVCIIGTPNVEAHRYACENSRQGHINLKSHETLRLLLQDHFQNVFIFSMNDEVVHTGFYQMAHYYMALAVGPKSGKE